jgi:hypothetical protein
MQKEALHLPKKKQSFTEEQVQSMSIKKREKQQKKRQGSNK